VGTRATPAVSANRADCTVSAQACPSPGASRGTWGGECREAQCRAVAWTEAYACGYQFDVQKKRLRAGSRRVRTPCTPIPRRQPRDLRLPRTLLIDLQIARTHSKPHVSDDKPGSEAQFKTLKYRSDFPKHVRSIEEVPTRDQILSGEQLLPRHSTINVPYECSCQPSFDTIARASAAGL
jgi:hypothetical protein